MFNFKNSSNSTISSTTPLNPSSVDPLFDSNNPSSPLYSPNYQVPVHSLKDSVAILKRNIIPPKVKQDKKESKKENKEFKPISFDSSDPSSPLYSPNYQVPVHSLADSIAIIKRNSPSPPPSSKKPTSSKDSESKSPEHQAPVYELGNSMSILRGIAGSKV